MLMTVYHLSYIVSFNCINLQETCHTNFVCLNCVIWIKKKKVTKMYPSYLFNIPYTMFDSFAKSPNGNGIASSLH